MNDAETIKLMVLNPGHFHASLVQKEMYPGVDKKVYVYAPAGMELDDYLQRISSYNSRSEDPTSWELDVYSGDDYLEKMLKEKPGNVVVLAGNNKEKTEYIAACIDAGLNVLSDKPMAIAPDDFELLKASMQKAEKKGLLIYDIMTERFEITSILQKILSEQRDIFGDLEQGSPDQPAITKESVHHFYKYVSGKPIKRPAWFFDVKQEGEAIADVGTHLVDLILWEAFPDGVPDYLSDIRIISSEKWTTDLNKECFSMVSGLESFPAFLDAYIIDDTLRVTANNSLMFNVRGIYAKVSVEWAFEAPSGAGDTHYSVMQGSLSDLIIQQGPDEQYRPELYIHIKNRKVQTEIEARLAIFCSEYLSELYPGITLEKKNEYVWKLNIPNRYRMGHEEHFARVTEKFLEYFYQGRIPKWEADQILTKYYTTTSAVNFSQ